MKKFITICFSLTLVLITIFGLNGRDVNAQNNSKNSISDVKVSLTENGYKRTLNYLGSDEYDRDEINIEKEIFVNAKSKTKFSLAVNKSKGFRDTYGKDRLYSECVRDSSLSYVFLYNESGLKASAPREVSYAPDECSQLDSTISNKLLFSPRIVPTAVKGIFKAPDNNSSLQIETSTDYELSIDDPELLDNNKKYRTEIEKNLYVQRYNIEIVLHPTYLVQDEESADHVNLKRSDKVFDQCSKLSINGQSMGPKEGVKGACSLIIKSYRQSPLLDGAILVGVDILRLISQDIPVEINDVSANLVSKLDLPIITNTNETINDYRDLSDLLQSGKYDQKEKTRLVNKIIDNSQVADMKNNVPSSTPSPEYKGFSLDDIKFDNTKKPITKIPKDKNKDVPRSPKLPVFHSEDGNDVNKGIIGIIKDKIFSTTPNESANVSTDSSSGSSGSNRGFKRSSENSSTNANGQVTVTNADSTIRISNDDTTSVGVIFKFVIQNNDNVNYYIPIDPNNGIAYRTNLNASVLNLDMVLSNPTKVEGDTEKYLILKPNSTRGLSYSGRLKALSDNKHSATILAQNIYSDQNGGGRIQVPINNLVTKEVNLTKEQFVETVAQDNTNSSIGNKFLEAANNFFGANNAPKIKTITPSTVVSGDTVTISGTNFSSTDNDIQISTNTGTISINKVPSTDGKTLVFTAPNYKGDFKVHVINWTTGKSTKDSENLSILSNGRVSTLESNVAVNNSRSNFAKSESVNTTGANSSSNIPTITNINPAKVSTGDLVTISGTNFSSTDNDIQISTNTGTVSINKVPSTDGKTLMFTAPNYQGDFKVSVINWSNGKSTQIPANLNISLSRSQRSKLEGNSAADDQVSRSAFSRSGLTSGLSIVKSPNLIISNVSTDIVQNNEIANQKTANFRYNLTLTNNNNSDLYLSKNTSAAIQLNLDGSQGFTPLSLNASSPSVLGGDTTQDFVIPTGSSRSFSYNGILYYTGNLNADNVTKYVSIQNIFISTSSPSRLINGIAKDNTLSLGRISVSGQNGTTTSAITVSTTIPLNTPSLSTSKTLYESGERVDIRATLPENTAKVYVKINCPTGISFTLPGFECNKLVTLPNTFVGIKPFFINRSANEQKVVINIFANIAGREGTIEGFPLTLVINSQNSKDAIKNPAEIQTPGEPVKKPSLLDIIFGKKDEATPTVSPYPTVSPTPTVSNPSLIKNYITITSPNGGEKIYVGSTYNISWTGNITNKTSALLVAENGTRYAIFVGMDSRTRNGTFYMPVSIPLGRYRVAMQEEITNASDFSDGYFEIVERPSYPGTPTPSSSYSPSYSNSATYSSSPSYTSTATYSSSPSYTSTATYSSSPSYTSSATYSSSPSYTSTATYTSSPSNTSTSVSSPSSVYTSTATYTASPSSSNTVSATATYTSTPSSTYTSSPSSTSSSNTSGTYNATPSSSSKAERNGGASYTASILEAIAGWLRTI